MDKEKLIDQYVNLYRQVNGSNEGLWTRDLIEMSEDELKVRITGFKESLEGNPFICKQCGNSNDLMVSVTKYSICGECMKKNLKRSGLLK